MTTIGITGHQALAPQAIAYIEQHLPGLLAEFLATDLLTSLAEGADQTCARIALESGVKLHVILPSENYDTTFDDTSHATYEQLLQQAASIDTLDYDEPTEQAFLAAGERVADLSDILVAVWDGKSAAGSGGTGDIVDYARHRGTVVKVLWPKGLQR